MTTTPSTNDLTRQQLEELDALLQRMLAAPTITEDRKPRPLPVDVAPPLPPTGEVLPENWRLDRPAPRAPHIELPAPQPVVKMTTVLEDHFLPPPAVHVPAPLALEAEEVNPADVTDDDLPTLSGFRLPTVPFTPSQVYSPPPELVPLQRELPADLPQFGRLSIADLKQPPLPQEAPPVEVAATPVEPKAEGDGIPMLAWPLVAVNWIAEECLKVFGGESLTKPAAKWSLGVAGLGMMAAAAVWALHGYGVVTLPIIK